MITGYGTLTVGSAWVLTELTLGVIDTLSEALQRQL